MNGTELLPWVIVFGSPQATFGTNLHVILVMVNVPGLPDCVNTDLCTSAEGSLLHSSTTSPSGVSAITGGCSCLQRL